MGLKGLNHMKQSVISETSKTKMLSKKVGVIVLALVVFFLLYLGLPDLFPVQARIMTAIVGLGIILWAFEPIPLGLTSFILLLLMLIFKVADIDVVLSGFASPAVYLIVAGMMLAKAVHSTSLMERLSYLILKAFGRTAKGLLGSMMIILQIQAFFIPATAVRTTLMLPVSSMILQTIGAKQGSSLQKMLMLGVAFGATMSGTAIMTAAIGNILAVDLLNRIANIKITYFDWFIYTFPFWLILTPAIWLLLIKLYPLPEEQQSFPNMKEDMAKKLELLGPINNQDKRCLIILIAIVMLWILEPFHGLHPVIPAIAGVILLTFPGIGCANWEDVVKINYNTVLLISITLSLGYALVDTGATQIISHYLTADWILTAMKSPLLAMTLITIFAQVFHKFMANVSTAVVTLMPIVITIALHAEVNPLAIGLITAVTCLYGFMLVVETMPNLIVHSSGMLSQRDFIKPGLYATVLTTLLSIVIAISWWKVLGLF